MVTLGCIQGLIQPRGVFLRTPKAKGRSGWAQALRVTQWDSGIGASCAAVGLAMGIAQPRGLTLLLALLLGWQASLYLAAPVYSLLSVRGAAPVRHTSRGDIQGQVVREGRAARWAFALIALLALSYGGLRFLPQPTETPRYVQFQPAQIEPWQLLGAPTGEPVSHAPTTAPSPAPASASATATLTATVLAPPTTVSRPTHAPAQPILVATATPAQPPARPSEAPVISTPTASVPAATPTASGPVAVAPVPVPTQRVLPSQVPTQRPLPTQVPTQPPVPVPTQRALPSQVPTQRPLPTQVPTQPPVPTLAPTQRPLPTQVPTQPPVPTQPAPPPHPTPRR